MEERAALHIETSCESRENQHKLPPRANGRPRRGALVGGYHSGGKSSGLSISEFVGRHTALADGHAGRGGEKESLVWGRCH